MSKLIPMLHINDRHSCIPTEDSPFSDLGEPIIISHFDENKYQNICNIVA